MNIDDITLISGVGDREAKELCVMSLTALIANEPHGDHPVCACPVLTSVAIRVNDMNWWDSDVERTKVLKPLAQAMVGTRNPALKLPRAKLFAARALRVWAPSALEAAANVHPIEEHRNALREHAAKLRADGSAAAADAAARKELRGQVIAAIYEAIALGN